MKKILTFVIVTILLLSNPGFAHDSEDSGDSHSSDGGNHSDVEMQNFPLSEQPKDEFLFAFEPMLPDEAPPLRVSDLKDLTVIGDEVYILLIDGRQFVYSLAGEAIDQPTYPLINGLWRFAFEEEDGKGYSLEIDGLSYGEKMDQDPSTYEFAIYERDSSSGNMIKRVTAPFGTKNFRLFHDRIAYRIKGQHQAHGLETNFLIHTLANSDWDESKIFSQDNATVKSFDFSPDGTEFSYIAAEGPKKDLETSWYAWGPIVENQITTAGSLTFQPSDAMNEDWIYTPWDMVTTNHGFVVMLKAGYSEAKTAPSFLRYYSSEGELLHEVQVNHCVKKFAQLAENKTLYLRMNEELNRLEVMKITWWQEQTSESRNTPRPLISERTFKNQTRANFRPDSFGILKKTDEESGSTIYRALLRSRQDEVQLRIPYEDVRDLCNDTGAVLQIENHDFKLQIPMAQLSCDDLLAGMPCETDATIEIRLSRNHENSISYSVDFFVVECRDDHTKLVHRTTLKTGVLHLEP